MKSIFLILSISIFPIMTNAQTKSTLIYVGDPMCSWCYGFSPELSEALSFLNGNVDLQLIMSGLRPYNTETMQDLSGFLKEHWEDVKKRSGQPFNYEVLQKDWVYDTEPPSRATLVVRKLAPEKELAFFKATQIAFYQDNLNMNLVETYLKIAKEFKLDPDKFKTLFESEEMKQAVQADFELASALGIRGFPAVVLKKGEEYFLISNGYTSGEQIVKKVTALDN